MVPSKPTIAHVLLCILAGSRSQNIVVDSKDEAKLLAEHSEQNEVNNIEKQVQVQANGGSGLPPRPPKLAPFDGKVLRRSPRLKTSPFHGKLLRRSPRLERDSTNMSPQDACKRH